MEANYISPFDWFALISNILFLIMFAHQAYMNLYWGQVSRFSIDALAVFLFIKFGSENARRKVKAFRKNVDRIFLMGIYSVFVVVGGVSQLILWLEKNT